MKDYSDIQPKEFQYTFQTWNRMACGKIKEVSIDNYECEYLDTYNTSLGIALSLGAKRIDNYWYLDDIKYKNVVELCQRRIFRKQ